MLILEIRECVFCGRRYQIAPTERKIMEENPRFAAVHDECLDEWKKLGPLAALSKYQEELLNAQRKRI